MQSSLVYHKGSIIGVDIGSHTAKLAQVHKSGKGIDVLVYGHIDFGPETVVEGVIVDPENLAKVIKPLLANVHGSAHKVATALPVAKVFTRILRLPPMEKSDLEEAVRLEAEQSIPVTQTDLYMDHEIIGTVKTDKGETHTDVLVVAAPRAIVDSYVKLFGLLNLEIAAIEISLMSIARTQTVAQQKGGPVLMIDFGASSADLAIVDGVVRLTGTVGFGGDKITATLAKNLGITPEQANEIKFKFGIGPSGLQSKVMTAINPLLKGLASEITKALKYYKDRYQGQEVKAIILSGGGASMPGLLQYLTENFTAATVSLANPWSNLNTTHVKALDSLESPLYTTVLGLALVEVMS